MVEGSGLFLGLRHPLSPTSMHKTLTPGLLEARFPFSVELYWVITRANCSAMQIILLCYVGGRRWLVSFGNPVKKLFWCFVD